MAGPEDRPSPGAAVTQDTTDVPAEMDRAGLINVCLAAFMATLDSYIVNISLPTIAASFGVGTGGGSAVILAYVLFLAGTLLVFGKLCDRHPGAVFVGGYAVFTLGSLLCGISPTLWTLVGARAIQGIGGAMLTVSAYALVPRLAPPDRTGEAFGMLATAAALGLTLGPPVGGFLTGYLGWHWIFLVNVPVGLVAIVLSSRSMPPPRVVGGSPFDLAGAVWSFLCMAATVVALNRGSGTGLSPSAVTFTAFLVPVFFALFVLAERRATDPLVDTALLRVRGFVVATLATVTIYLLLAGHNFLIPFYLNLVCGLDPQTSGLVLMVYSLVYLGTTHLTGRAADRLGPGRLCLAGSCSAVLACGVFAATLSRPGLGPVVLFLAWLAVSYGLFVPPNSKIVMGLAPPEHRGAASGFFSLVSRVSLLLGVCMFELLFSMAMPASGSLATAHPPRDLLVEGFRHAYAAGGVCALVGVGLSWALQRHL